jgi:lipoate-protein ligase A
LLLDSPADGAWNMAVDETLLRSHGSSDASFPATLRLYSWKPVTLSLGRTQVAADGHDPEFIGSRGIALVRRPTGGRAVLHDQERTYAVVSRSSGLFPGGVLETYRRISAALRQALIALGIPAETAGGEVAEPSTAGEASCFAAVSSHETVVRGRKVVGSAQLRRRHAFLQHGSILLHADAVAVGGATGTPAFPRRFAGLDAALGYVPSPDQVDGAVVHAPEGVEIPVGGVDPGRPGRPH